MGAMTRPNAGYQGFAPSDGIQPLGMSAPPPMPPQGYQGYQGYQGFAPTNDIQPLGAQTSGFYQAPYPQPWNYLPFGSGTTIGPTPQHPDMEGFNFMRPGGVGDQMPGPSEEEEAPPPEQTAMGNLLDRFLGVGKGGRSGVRMFMGGTPGLGPRSLRNIDTAIEQGVLPRNYRVPFRNQRGNGWGSWEVNQ